MALLSLDDTEGSCLERDTNIGMKQERMFENCQFCSQVYMDRKCETNNISIHPHNTLFHSLTSLTHMRMYVHT